MELVPVAHECCSLLRVLQRRALAEKSHKTDALGVLNVNPAEPGIIEPRPGRMKHLISCNR